MLGVLLAVLLVLAVWLFAGLPSLGAFGLLGTLSWWLARLDKRRDTHSRGFFRAPAAGVKPPQRQWPRQWQS